MPSGENSGSKRVLHVNNVTKNYISYAKPIYRLYSFFFKPKPSWHSEFQALKNISFSLQKGETVGIIGRNGSGKSTLLQTIVGTLATSSGEVQSFGRIAALLELGAGFNPEFTGRENVYLNGTIYGLSREQVDQRFDEIEKFADIGSFINQPVKTYSSGMFVRLAFAVIAHVDADILIIDEALAVGDALFAQKCMRFLESFKENGTILFVSHDSGAVTSLCDRAIWLDAGELKLDGDAKSVTEAYLEHLYSQEQDISKQTVVEVEDVAKEAFSETAVFEEFYDVRAEYLKNSNLRNDIKLQPFDIQGSSFGSGKVEIRDVCIRDLTGRKLAYVTGGEKILIEIRFVSNASLDSLIVGFLFKNRLGQVLFGDNNYLIHKDSPINVEKGKTYCAQMGVTLPYILSGEYVISAGVASGTQEQHVQHCWYHDALVLNVVSDHMVHGLIGLPLGSCTVKALDGA
ncbi:MAG: ABC transporter ATP-binding protein [Cellvibrionaceae bacterium]|nr:ABC transporter ATP-binding protein [Cellvibrionaceae bacterium]